MERAVEEQTEITEIIEEGRALEEEMENKYGPDFIREYLRRYGPLQLRARRYPDRTVAGISPELARILDLTEEEIRQYSATSGNP